MVTGTRHYFTRAEVAGMFDVSPNTVSRWVRGGKIPSVVTPGGRNRYPVAVILRLVQAFQDGSPLSPPSDCQR